MLDHANLTRLEGGLTSFYFGDTDDSLTLFAHHPTAEEISAALAEANCDLERATRLQKEREQRGGESPAPAELEETARLGYAQEILGCYCVESGERNEKGQPPKPFRFSRPRGKFGLRRITDEDSEPIDRFLREVGAKLLNTSKPSKEEGER